MLWCEEKLAALQMAAERPTGGFAILVNSGNANAFTGVERPRRRRGDGRGDGGALAVPPDHVFVASTGVIGEPLPAERIVAALDGLAAGLSADAAERAAARDHDHRHLPEGRGGQARPRRRRR